MKNIFKFLFALFLGVLCCACVNTVAVHELNHKASQYLEEGNVNAAIARLEASVDLDGSVYESRYNLASAYMTNGQCENALEHITAALELKKNEPVVYYTHGVASLCVADKISEKQKEGIALSDMEQNKVNELIKNANASFDKYVSLAPGAEDAQAVIDLIKSNEARISGYNQ